MLTTQIREDMKNAMKAKDEITRDTLRGAISAFTNELVSKGKKPTEELSDTEALSVLKRLAKQRKDSVEQFTNGGRPELAEKESRELSVIEKYLPQTMGRSEIEKIARDKMTELGITDASGTGKLTGAVMKQCAGAADGNDVKDVVAGLFT